MKEKRNSMWKRAVSILMAAAMLFSVIVIVPDEAKAAEYSFKDTGTSAVTIPDSDSTRTTHQYNWIKFRPKKTGAVTITVSNASASAKYTNGTIVLCDAAKQFLDYTADYYTTSKPDDARYSNITYGVKAKTTYYFRVESNAGVSLKATVTAISKKNAGKTRKKAKTLARNKEIKGVIVAEDKTADWYKITLPKSKKILLSYSVKTNGWDGNAEIKDGIRITFCDSMGRQFAENAYDDLNREKTKNSGIYYLKKNKSKKKLPLNPGTYYVKVERLNKYSSGEYTLKWQTS